MRKPAKITAAIAGSALAIATVGTAYAYWTTSGSGKGEAATASGAVDTLSIEGVSAGDLFPGSPARVISGTVTNTGDQTAYVKEVVASIASVTPVAGASCDASNYSIDSTPMPVGKDLANGGSAPFTGATISFVNKAENQDGCKGATVNLAFSAS